MKAWREKREIRESKIGACVIHIEFILKGKIGINKF